MSDTGHDTQYGFIWGPIEVSRATFLGTEKRPGHRVLFIETGRDKLQVYVSDKGRSVRVYKNHKELK